MSFNPWWKCSFWWENQLLADFSMGQSILYGRRFLCGNLLEPDNFRGNIEYNWRFSCRKPGRYMKVYSWQIHRMLEDLAAMFDCQSLCFKYAFIFSKVLFHFQEYGWFLMLCHQRGLATWPYWRGALIFAFFHKCWCLLLVEVDSASQLQVVRFVPPPPFRSGQTCNMCSSNDNGSSHWHLIPYLGGWSACTRASWPASKLLIDSSLCHNVYLISFWFFDIKNLKL